MQQIQVEWAWLDDSETITLPELSQCCGMSESELEELVDYCALVPLDAMQLERVFSAQCVTPLRAVGKLRLDFDLDLFTVAMVLSNLNRIEVLQRQVLSLQAQLSPRTTHAAGQ